MVYSVLLGRDIMSEEEAVDKKSLARTPESQGSVTPKGWKPTVTKPLPVIQCVQIKRDGVQCGRWSIRGMSHCLVHGGRLPNYKAHAEAVVEAARLRMIGMTDSAIDVIEDLSLNASAEQVRLKASTEILDRAGVRAGVEIDFKAEINQGETAAERTMKHLEETARRMEESRRAAEEVELDEDVVDAEVIDED